MQSVIATLLLALAAPCLGELHKNDHSNLRSALHLDAKVSGAWNGHGLVTANLTSYLNELAVDCNCQFKGVCTCEGSLEFMGCISSACSSGKCNCQGSSHILWACGNMSATCPNVGLQCDATGKATCMKEEPVAPVTVAPTVAPQTAPAQKMAEPAAADSKPTQSWKDWLMSNHFLVRSVAFFFEIIPFLIAAVIYNMYRFKMNFAQTSLPASSVGFGYGLFGCFEDTKIMLLAWCCSPLRWADTMEKAPGGGIMAYWKGIVIFIVLTGLSPLLGGISSLILLVIVTMTRQRLRRNFGMNAGGLTILEDCCTYLWCGCCAIVQEARQVESTKYLSK